METAKHDSQASGVRPNMDSNFKIYIKSLLGHVLPDETKIKADRETALESQFFNRSAASASKRGSQTAGFMVNQLMTVNPLIEIQIGLVNMAGYAAKAICLLLMKSAALSRQGIGIVSYYQRISIFTTFALSAPLLSMLPGVSAQTTGPLAVTQTITTQLAQNAVVLGFGVMLGAGRIMSPLAQLSNGPLAAISSASWAFDLLRVKQDARLPVRSSDHNSMYFSESAKLDEQDRINSWLSIMAMVVSTWTLGFLGLLNHLALEAWSWWYVAGVIAFVIAELSRYLAAYLTYTGTLCVHSTGEHYYFAGAEYYPMRDQIKRYTRVAPGLVELSRNWTAFAGPIERIYPVKGFFAYVRVWKTPIYAAGTLLLCLISAIAALTFMAAIVLSDATDVVTGLWCLVTSMLASGLYEPLANEPIINEMQVREEAERAALISRCFPEVDTTGGDSLQEYVYNAVLFPGETVKYKRTAKPLRLSAIQSPINLHKVMCSFIAQDKAWQRVCAYSTRTLEGNGIWLEIADYMYTSLLTCVRHDAGCREHCSRVKWPGTCSTNVEGISAMALAVAHHVRCEEVNRILANLRDYMELSTYQYVLAAAVGLEQIAMKEVREKIRHTSPATAAANAVMMEWFGDVMEMSDAMQTLIITAYLLGKSNVLGNSMSKAVETIDGQFGGAVLTVTPGNLHIQVQDISLEVHVAMHVWPSQFPPRILEYADADQPHLYAFILIYMLKPAKTLKAADEREADRLTEIVEELDV